jgi:hypothetical protein
MDEQETVVDVVTSHRTFRGCSTWLATLASVVILGVTGVGPLRSNRTKKHAKENEVA